MSDGGEGFLDALGGANRRALVTGPLGDPVEAGWRLDGKRAVVEMAQASGIGLVGGPEGNDPVAAATHGTGELIAAAVDAGARMVTHLFNGMSGVHHREPGVAAFAVTDDRLCASVIADGVHVHPRVVALAFRALGKDRAVLVTDAVAWRSGRARGARRWRGPPRGSLRRPSPRSHSAPCPCRRARGRSARR